jgi:hypothetical protein
MPDTTYSEPVKDTVSKVDGEVAVGEDLGFQRKWWRFERAVWIIFSLLIILDVAGVFGRGPVSHAQRAAGDGSIDVKYERIERTGTPSILTVTFGPSAIRDGKVELFVSETIVKQLGAQRVIPSPETTVVGQGGLTYTFPASQIPASVEFALQPAGPGITHFALRVPGAETVSGDVVIVP